VNLASRDIRRHLGRFVGTVGGLGLLFAVVVSMQGIYAGLVDDATILTRAMGAELWVVQRGTNGPFAEVSRLDPTLEARVAAVPGVARARAYSYQLIQRQHAARQLRLAIVGLAWPDDSGSQLPLVAGRALAQAHGEMIVDASSGLGIGQTIELAREPYRVVGLTRNALTSSGDAVVFMTLSDSQLVATDTPADALRTERARVLDRLRRTDLGRSQPGLEDLVIDPSWRAPALASPSINSVLVNLRAPADLSDVRAVLAGWPDVQVYSQAEEQDLLLQGVVERAKMQLGLFSIILSLTAAVIVMLVVYNMTLDKTHDLAVLKLLGASSARLVLIVLEQAWLLGALAYLFAFALGELSYPYFPRRVVLTPQILLATPVVVAMVTTLASLLGVVHALHVDASRVLEG
jgi:putative ABC transport system permease protein